MHNKCSAYTHSVFLLTVWMLDYGMLKLGRMRRQTRETSVDPTALLRQMRDVSGFFNNLVLTNTLGPHKITSIGLGAFLEQT